MDSLQEVKSGTPYDGNQRAILFTSDFYPAINLPCESYWNDEY
jgi:hypothetical protein